MTKYRHDLPNGKDRLFLLDGGLETTLVFNEGMELPAFAAYPLLADQAGRKRLRDYYTAYAGIAARSGAGFILEGIGWRANRDWGAQLGHDSDALAVFNRESIRLLEELRTELETPAMPMVISGCVGPRGDGYVAGTAMTVAEAKDYHGEQIATYAATAADQVTAMTMTSAEEAAGIALAARLLRMPSAISFTVETDGNLPTGQNLKDAIAFVDDRAGKAPAYYMINCAHPDHFAHVLEPEAAWMERLRGLRANSSRMSHAELDESTELDDGNPVELGNLYAGIRSRFPNFTVLGGCCGTDERHVGAIAGACCLHHANAA